VDHSHATSAGCRRLTVADSEDMVPVDPSSKTYQEFVRLRQIR
jgi:hypothetical protein